MLPFSLIVGLGATLGVWQVARSAPPRETSRWVDAALFSLLLALLGARMMYVALEWPYFAGQPLEMFQIWLGGFAWPGALLGWLAGVGLAALLWRKPFSAVADGLSPMLVPLSAGILLGCWGSGCAYAPALPQGDWRGILAPDERGILAPRLPLQPLLAMGYIGFAALVTALLRPPRSSGLYASFLLLGLALTAFITALASSQPTRQAGGLPLDAWFALGLGSAAVLWIAWDLAHRWITERRKAPIGH